MKEISIIEIFKKLFGEDVLAEDYPESGTLAYKIRAREYKITVSGIYADEITQDYMYEDEDKVEVNIRTENYLGHFFREDFLCHFELDKLTKTLPATFSTNEIEEWMNGCIKEAINNFNSYIVADLEDDNEIYLEVPDQTPLKLIDLNKKWVEESFVLVGENPFKDDGRLYQLRNPWD
tara:strand:+ start:742 stop:1275 length:534 start_codon:yes stop_codon:yes gene_type:complete